MRGSKSSGSLVVGHGGDVENEGKRERGRLPIGERCE